MLYEEGKNISDKTAVRQNDRNDSGTSRVLLLTTDCGATEIGFENIYFLNFLG